MTIAGIITIGFNGNDNTSIATLGFSVGSAVIGTDWVPRYSPAPVGRQTAPQLQRLRQASAQLTSFRKIQPLLQMIRKKPPTLT